MSSFCFVVKLETQIKEKFCSETALRWKKAYLDVLIVFVELIFRLRHSYLANVFGFLILRKFVFLFVVAGHIPDKNRYLVRLQDV